MRRQFIAFGIVGIIGLCFDVLILYFLNPFCGPFISRFFSFLVAVIVTWVLNRRFTFKGRTSNLALVSEFFSYFGFMVFGGIVNYVSYACFIVNSEYILNHLYIGVGLGSLSGMLVNYLTSRFLLYRNDVSEAECLKVIKEKT